MPPRMARLIGYGAFGGILVFALIFALVLWAAFPRSTSGIDGIEAAVTFIALFLVFLAIAGVQVLIGRGLLAYSRGERRLV